MIKKTPSFILNVKTQKSFRNNEYLVRKINKQQGHCLTNKFYIRNFLFIILKYFLLVLGFQGAIFYFNCEHSLCVHCKTKIRGLHKNISWIFKFLKNLLKIEFCWRQIFEILYIHKPSLGSREVPQNQGPIDSAVLTFIGYKHTVRQTEKQSMYIDKM